MFQYKCMLAIKDGIALEIDAELTGIDRTDVSKQLIPLQPDFCRTGLKAVLFS